MTRNDAEDTNAKGRGGREHETALGAGEGPASAPFCVRSSGLVQLIGEGALRLSGGRRLRSCDDLLNAYQALP